MRAEHHVETSQRLPATCLGLRLGKPVVFDNGAGAGGLVGADLVAEAKTLKELVALAKAAPDKYTFASSGNGGSPHLTAKIFQQATGIRLRHVPYKGGGPAMADLIAGHVDMLFASVLETSGYVKSGKLRALAVTSAQHSPVLPDFPTLAAAIPRGITPAKGR